MTDRTNERGLSVERQDTVQNEPDHTSEADERLLQHGKYTSGGPTDDGEGISGCYSQRWIVAFMGLFYGFILYLLRVNISVAIVAMNGSPTPNVSEHADTKLNRSLLMSSYNVTADINVGECGHSVVGSRPNGDVPAELDWDKTQQALVLSSFFYGYIVTQIPGGWIAARYGGKRVIAIVVGIASILTILFPICARTHVNLAIGNRVVMGIILGPVNAAKVVEMKRYTRSLTGPTAKGHTSKVSLKKREC